jgi:regulatory protein
MRGKEIALKYLALRARTVLEMRRHLIEKGLMLEDIDVIIRDLIKADYLNDKKYAIDYIPYGRSKNRGQIRIAKELSDKGVCEEDIEAALLFLNEEEILYKESVFSEREIAEKLGRDWVKKEKIDEKLLKKIARKLGALGYDGDTIYGVIGVLMSMESGNNGSD